MLSVKNGSRWLHQFPRRRVTGNFLKGMKNRKSHRRQTVKVSVAVDLYSSQYLQGQKTEKEITHTIKHNRICPRFPNLPNSQQNQTLHQRRIFTDRWRDDW